MAPRSMHTPEEPTYLVTGATLSEDPVFQGAVFSSSGNVLTFSQIQDEELPHLNVDPFVAGALASSKARATATIDAIDGNVTQITVDYAGSGYVGIPEVQISYPDSGTDPSTAVNAEANATISAGGVASIIMTEGGKGYTTAPTVTIEGGSHFLRITEPDGDYEGRFFLITANDGTTLTLDNPDNEDFATIFPQDTNVEIVSSHTLGSVFGITDCLLILDSAC